MEVFARARKRLSLLWSEKAGARRGPYHDMLLYMLIVLCFGEYSSADRLSQTSADDLRVLL